MCGIAAVLLRNEAEEQGGDSTSTASSDETLLRGLRPVLLRRGPDAQAEHTCRGAGSQPSSPLAVRLLGLPLFFSLFNTLLEIPTTWY